MNFTTFSPHSTVFTPQGHQGYMAPQMPAPQNNWAPHPAQNQLSYHRHMDKSASFDVNSQPQQ